MIAVGSSWVGSGFRWRGWFKRLGYYQVITTSKSTTPASTVGLHTEVNPGGVQTTLLVLSWRLLRNGREYQFHRSLKRGECVGSHHLGSAFHRRISDTNHCKFRLVTSSSDK
jgi:hypothetical protein